MPSNRVGHKAGGSEKRSSSTSPSPKPLGGSWSRFCDSSLVRRIRTRRNRRMLVVFSIMVLGAMPIVGWVTDELWITATLLVPYLAINVLIAASIGGLLDRKVKNLDERERIVRVTVFREPYVVGVTIGFVAGWVGFSGFPSERGWMNGVMLAILASAYLVPTSVLAWKLPEDLHHEE